MSDYEDDITNNIEEYDDEIEIEDDIEIEDNNNDIELDDDNDNNDIDNKSKLVKTSDDILNDDDEYDDEYEFDYENEDDNDELNDKEYMEDNIGFNNNEDDLDTDSTFQYIIKNEDRITSNILTKYELIELISTRAKQISNGCHIFTNVNGLTDPIEMAKKEIADNKCPLSLMRNIGLNKYELIFPNHMAKPKI